VREATAGLVSAVDRDPRVTVVAQTPELFAAGLELYRQRPDKAYSMTDCMSMALCRDLQIAEVLTYDRDFEQEGFRAVLRS